MSPSPLEQNSPLQSPPQHHSPQHALPQRSLPQQPRTPEHADPGRLRVDLQRTLSDCIVIDLETTGLRPQQARIIEIAALRVADGEITDRFATLLNPHQDVPEEVTDLTGISAGLLADQPTFAEVLPDLMHFLRPNSPTGATLPAHAATPRLVGHNVSFDFSFIQHEILRAQLAPQTQHGDTGMEPTDIDSVPPYTPRLVCTAEASRALIPRESVGRYRLGNVASYLKVPHRPLHRAMNDALATYGVLRALTEQ
ncbi:PolC-type DNA polymerase III [Corynebacterium macclintockiae]|uniref:3'-5' exonuclease n=1 Tax=Corynebacterium macclintockiae TaxID=2913501 RepID=UPI003EBD68AA